MVVLVVSLLSVSGCSSSSHYSSVDLALLPCEMGPAGGPAPFFYPLEFTANGDFAYPEQMDRLKLRIARHQFEDPPLYDLVVFLHGWNKNPFSAEADYQNFLCRLHARLRVLIRDEKASGGLIVVGLFWPSTIANTAQEAQLLTPWSYYRMRSRADAIATRGLAGVFESLTPILENIKKRHVSSSASQRVSPLQDDNPGENEPSISQRDYGGVRLKLIGHSFGGRMLVTSLEAMSRKETLVRFLLASGNVNVVLLNAAVPSTRFNWIAGSILKAQADGPPGATTMRSFLFNVHSFNDGANRVLFPIASLFDDDPVGCGAGACGVPNYATICVNSRGRIGPELREPAPTPLPGVTVWNVDASRIIFSHTDIYKGRVADLVSELMYGSRQLQRVAAVATGPTAGRCLPAAPRP